MKGRLLFILLFLLFLKNSSAYAIPGSYTSNANIEVNYTTFEGKYLFLEILQTTCGACIDMHPIISDLYDSYKSRASFLSLVYNDQDIIPVLQDFVTEHPTSWNIGRDPNIAYHFQMQYTPTILILDKSSNILNRWDSGQTYGTFAASLDQLPSGDDVSVTSLSNTDYVDEEEDIPTWWEKIVESPITKMVVIITIVVLIYRKSIAPKP